ncbi:MAG: ABC transporter permease [bacterium]|nr:MAG: ABC transporter permease [bacterium]
MRSLFAIEKVDLAAAVTGAVPLFGLGFVIVRPNRLAEGVAVSLREAAGSLAVVIAVLWLLLIVLAVSAVPGRVRYSIIGITAGTLIPLLLLAAGRQAAMVAASQGTIARVSLGPGFWFSLFALTVILVNSLSGRGQTRSILVAVAVLSAGTVLYLLLSGRLDALSLMREFAQRRSRFFLELRSHLVLAITSVVTATAIGLPLGLLTHRKAATRAPTFFTLNTLQTIPSLALFGILIPVLAALTARFPFLSEVGVQGIGTAPALIALIAYSLLPVVRNTYTGFSTVDPAVVEAGLGMGMTRGQLLIRIELPIACPVILNGIRVALVQTVGLTAVAALIGAGGFGVFIFQGLGQAASDLILLGAVPTIVIAVIADTLMNAVTGVIRPRGLR